MSLTNAAAQDYYVDMLVILELLSCYGDSLVIVITISVSPG